MSAKSTTITIRLSPQEVARLDEIRGSTVSRSAYVRALLRRSGPPDGYATHTEALEILTQLARGGKVAAAIALEKALRTDQPASELEDFLRGG